LALPPSGLDHEWSCALKRFFLFFPGFLDQDPHFIDSQADLIQIEFLRDLNAELVLKDRASRAVPTGPGKGFYRL
jgi:hypothetical protein